MGVAMIIHPAGNENTKILILVIRQQEMKMNNFKYDIL